MMVDDKTTLDFFVDSVIDNLEDVNLGNALKIKTYIKIKDTDTGIELSDFFKTFAFNCAQRACRSDEKCVSVKYSNLVCITLRANRELQKYTVQKQNVFDMWLFDIIDTMESFSKC